MRCTRVIGGLTIAGAVLLAGAAFADAAPLPAADEIVARFLDAIGGRQALDAVNSLIIRGQYSEAGETSPAALSRMRPFYKIVGDPDAPSKDFAEGYDGSAWEFYGDPGIVVRTVGPASAATRHGLAILGPLVDYKAQGSTVVTVGKEKIGDREAYDVRVHMSDGYEEDEFIDSRNWLLIASRKAAPIHAFGAAVNSETRFSDFRRVDGVLFAFRNEETQIATDKVLNTFAATSITVNEKIDPAAFSPPEPKRTPLQTLLYQLFAEREDVQAVLWSYRDFRRAYPQIDTDEGIEVIGYQMLKMGDSTAAVALLGENAVAYPNSTGAAFGLGRAYDTAGNAAKARAQFQRALALDPGNKRAKAALDALAPTP